MGSDFRWRDGSGGMFANDKAGNPERPDCTGTATYGGKEVRLAGWWKEKKDGTGKWLSIRIEHVKPAQQPAQNPPAQAATPAADSNIPAQQPAQKPAFEDDIPF